MGIWMPPAYGVEDIMKTIEKIATLDEKINELAIERENYVKDLKEQIKKNTNTKD